MIATLRLQDFRCFGHLSIQVPKGGGMFVGGNAQGKTSLLEAVCVLVRLHSPRTHKMSAMVRRGTNGFGVAGSAWEMERQVRAGIDGNRWWVDRVERAGPGDYLADGGLLVWMGNEDMALVRGTAAERRRYLDFLGTQLDPEYRRALGRYRQALRMRNLLLKEPRIDEPQVRAYDEILLGHGALLMRVRNDVVKALAPLAAAAQAAVAGGREVFGMTYLASGGPDFQDAFAAAAAQDRRLRQTTTGPHRDDLAFAIDGQAAAEYASEGQQRTMALALKLAQGSLLEARRGFPPVYLLDDVFGELDVERRNALLAAMPQRAQKWIATTHDGWLADMRGLDELRRFEVRDGNVF